MTKITNWMFAAYLLLSTRTVPRHTLNARKSMFLLLWRQFDLTPNSMIFAAFKGQHITELIANFRTLSCLLAFSKLVYVKKGATYVQANLVNLVEQVAYKCQVPSSTYKQAALFGVTTVT